VPNTNTPAGIQKFIDQGALDVIQPDIYWCGGLTETLKIAAYATAYDLVTIPHGHSSFVTAHFSAVQSPIHTPYQEYLVKWNAVHQHFLVDPLDVIDGMIHVPTRPGLAMEIDASEIEANRSFSLIEGVVDAARFRPAATR
jgi:L-rhamnonate dehydratase